MTHCHFLLIVIVIAITLIYRVLSNYENKQDVLKNWLQHFKVIQSFKVIRINLQSNLYKTTGGSLIKHLYKTTTNKIWSFLAGF